MRDYEQLLEFATTDRQKEILQTLIDTNTVKDAVAKLGLNSERSVYEMLQKLRYNVTKKGKGDHFISETNIPEGLFVKSTSTLYKTEDKLQWVKTDTELQNKIKSIEDAIVSIMENVNPIEPVIFNKPTYDDLVTNYILNDLHFGALSWKQETLDRDNDLNIIQRDLKAGIAYLVEVSPPTKIAIVSDLGDLTEMDDFKNLTPKSGNSLDVDGRYSKVLRVAMTCMVDVINMALIKHEIVHFYNVPGNHDATTSYAIMAFIEAWYRNEPRVIVDTSPAPHKYFQHGSTLIGYTHGDGTKMQEAGEVMAMHNPIIWSETINRYYHFGHNHKDKVFDGRLCKSESHRNLPPLNSWASKEGMGRQIGTMKSITYCKRFGEKSRQIFNVAMAEDNNGNI